MFNIENKKNTTIDLLEKYKTLEKNEKINLIIYLEKINPIGFVEKSIVKKTPLSEENLNHYKIDEKRIIYKYKLERYKENIKVENEKIKKENIGSGWVRIEEEETRVLGSSEAPKKFIPNIKETPIEESEVIKILEKKGGVFLNSFIEHMQIPRPFIFTKLSEREEIQKKVSSALMEYYNKKTRNKNSKQNLPNQNYSNGHTQN